MLSSSYRCLLSLQRSLPSFSVFKAVSRSFSSKPIQKDKIDPEADNLIQETSTESYTEPIPLDVAAKQVSALKTDSTAPGTAETGSKETSGAGIPPVTQDTITAWFDFMDIREKPYGNWKTYEPDQIFSSLEFDLYGKNCEEIYKYEKDDLFVNFDILKRVKMPQMVEVPKVKNEGGQRYLNDVCFELNRNPHYSFEDKVELVNFLKKIIDDDSYLEKIRNKSK